MKRFVIIGLIGFGLVTTGAVWAWLQLAQDGKPQPPIAELAPPAAPVPAAAPPVDAVDPIRPSFDVVRVNPTGDAVMAGRAAPNAVVTIYDGGREIGRVQADSRGEWVFVPHDVLPPGARELGLAAQTPDGATLRSDQVVVLAVPERGRDLAGQPVAQTAPALAVATSRDGTGRSTVLQLPEADAARGMQLTLDAIDYGDNGGVIFGGRASPNASIQVYRDNQFIGRTVADAQGNWTLAPSVTVPPGDYAIRVDQLGADGHVIARVEVPFSRAELGRQLAEGESQVVVQPGNSLWRIARRVYGEGIQYSVLYDANKGQIRDPDRIYPGQVFVVPTIN